MTEIILPEDDRAATYRTDIAGWVSREGRFFGDGAAAEDMARYTGATHRRCKSCGDVIENRWTTCAACVEKRRRELYLVLPEADWDGEAPLYSDARDCFYSDLDEAKEDLYEGETLADLRLILCEPVYARPLELDYFEDQLPENDYVPPALEDAIEEFNNAINRVLVSWKPGKKRLKMEDVR